MGYIQNEKLKKGLQNTMHEEENPFEFAIRLNSIALENFRGFGTLDLSFHEKLTLLISENGGGKTSILDALANCLAGFINQVFLEENNFIYDLKGSDVRVGVDAGRIKSSISIDYDIYDENSHEGSQEENEAEEEEEEEIDTSGLSFLERGQFLFNIDLIKGLGVQDTQLFEADENNLIVDLIKSVKSHQNDNSSIPVLAYYQLAKSNNFNEKKRHNKLRNNIYSQFAIYEDVLEAGKSFRQFFNWFTQYEKNKYQYNWEQLVQKIERIETEKDKDITSNTPALVKDSLLNYIKEQVEKNKIPEIIEFILNDKEATYSNVRVEFSEEGDIFKIDKNGVSLSNYQLSSGEKILLGLFGDLTYRLLLANPSLENPLEGNGIVLIDEIGIHLHPKWQRKVIPKLCDLFPNIQFVITTHSPFVIQGVEKSEDYLVIGINEGIYEHLPKVDGLYYETIIEQYLGVKHDFGVQTTEKLKKFHDFIREIERDKSVKENPDFKKLLEEFSNMGGDVRWIIAKELYELKNKLSENGKN